QRIHLLNNVVILAGAGVGGGSLNYANTLYEPPEPFFTDPQWAAITDWRSELAPYYAQAKRMLGVVRNPTMTPSDVEMKRLAERAGATVVPLTTVTGVRPQPGGGYQVSAVRTGSWRPRRESRVYTAEQVVFSAGTYSTQKLLHGLRASTLPGISARLGQLTR